MKLPIYQVDAFSAQRFSGNPAAVCVLPEAADEAWMQQQLQQLVAEGHGSFCTRHRCRGAANRRSFGVTVRGVRT